MRMDIENTIQSEISQTGKNKDCILSYIHRIWKKKENKKTGIDNLIYKAEIEVDVGNKHMDPKGVMWDGMNWVITTDIYTLWYNV